MMMIKLDFNYRNMSYMAITIGIQLKAILN